MQYKNKAAARRGQHGHSRTPAGYWMPDPGPTPPKGFGTQADQSYCAYQAAGAQFDMTHAEWCLVARLSVRYRRFIHHMTEVAPGWQEVPGSKVCWANNSVEITERASDGRTRIRQLVAPHGDVC